MRSSTWPRTSGFEPGWDRIVPDNIEATIGVFDAARRAGVDHIVFASSNHVTGGYEHDEPYRSVLRDDAGPEPGDFELIGPASPAKPDGPYGLSKVFGENLARFHSVNHGMRVQCLRIGSCVPEDVPLDTRHRSTFISQRDVALLIEACLRSTVDFGVYYGVSDNRWRIWDLDAARVDLGWTPLDSADRPRAVATNGDTVPADHAATFRHPPRRLHPVVARAGHLVRSGRRRVVKAIRVLRSG